MNDQDFKFDFAMSYAGEDSKVVEEISRRLQELSFNVFCARDVQNLLVGVNGEDLFEQLFKEAKEVIVFISKYYKKKDWPRFEWDVIRERDYINRFIPIRLDNAKILGMPSNIFYKYFDGQNYNDIVNICVEKLLCYEKEAGIKRPTEYESILKAIQKKSSGALATAYQLVKDRRKRTPLEDCELPKGNWRPCYEVVQKEWCNFSTIKRRSIKILVPPNLVEGELVFNLKHCAAMQFNAFKPDAIAVLAYKQDPELPSVNRAYDAGRLYFAPFGDWGRALDGFAYSIPTSEFKYSFDLVPSYFDG